MAAVVQQAAVASESCPLDGRARAPSSDRDLLRMESGELEPLDDMLYENVRHASVETLRTLMQTRNGLATHRNSQGHNALLVAARLGRFDVVRYLVREGLCDPKGDAGDDGATALHWSIIAGHGDLVRWFVDACDADPLHPDELGNNAVHYAACCGRLNILRWLLEERGADGTRKNDMGRDAVWWAVEKGQDHVLRWLQQNPHVVGKGKGGKGTAVGSPDCIDSFLAGSSPEHSDSEGEQRACTGDDNYYSSDSD